jgi:hypothetical protein
LNYKQNEELNHGKCPLASAVNTQHEKYTEHTAAVRVAIFAAYGRWLPCVIFHAFLFI